MKKETKDVLSVRDVSRICCVSPETIRRWIRRHGLKAFNTTGRRAIKIRRTDLEEFTSSNNVYADWSILLSDSSRK